MSIQRKFTASSEMSALEVIGVPYLPEKSPNDWVVLTKPLLFLVEFVPEGTYHIHATTFAPTPGPAY